MKNKERKVWVKKSLADVAEIGLNCDSCVVKENCPMKYKAESLNCTWEQSRNIKGNVQ